MAGKHSQVLHLAGVRDAVLVEVLEQEGTGIQGRVVHVANDLSRLVYADGDSLRPAERAQIDDLAVLPQNGAQFIPLVHGSAHNLAGVVQILGAVVVASPVWQHQQAVGLIPHIGHEVVRRVGAGDLVVIVDGAGPARSHVLDLDAVVQEGAVHVARHVAEVIDVDGLRSLVA